MKYFPGKPRSRLGWLYTVHLWVGIVVGLQLLLWTASGLFMTANAIETVRGEHLRRSTVTDLRTARGLVPPDAILRAEPVKIDKVELAEVLGAPVYRLQAGDARWLVDARTGARRTLTGPEALAIVRGATTLTGTATVTPVIGPPPLELRKPGADWLTSWPDGTHVYVGPAGDIIAVRTALWRWHDFAWGLHILDPGGREDTHHPLLIGSALLALFSVLSGLVLAVQHFRRRRI